MNRVSQDYRISAHFIGEQDGKQWFAVDGGYIILIPLENIMHQDIEELAQMCQWLMESEALDVPIPIKNKNGEWVTEGDEEQGRGIVAFFVKAEKKSGESGRVLAHFHRNAQAFSFKRAELTPYYRWAEFWIARTDQVKQYYLDTLQKETHTEFERRFLSVYPYFIGRAENAIQYMTDFMMDFWIGSPPTICHHRLDARLEKLAYSPEWVIDHPGRDIAEWMRSQIHEGNADFKEVTAFINDYNEVHSLQSSDYGLIYSRLLFPVTFFDFVDQVFVQDKTLARVSLDQVQKLSANAALEEEILSQFSEVYMKTLPKIQWLS
ncbi:spore coat protein YutH [Pullulanibacillus pueri]|uniref:Endospore coat-associated protein YutH n=1 Tax=Pullulanibacillus pueri TaxID=1437324 RepID=A0A8J3EL51_9BACL|nr:hypothetical protein [Pullulanibacillus pueri]MBM7680428.1 spore coat protein YutH [Pullulanibacillus pueri]GGH75132.1 endospore coat-associated protein YutH [Pullulanibacillus pueri]